MNPNNARKIMLRHMVGEVEHQITHETQTDCVHAARAEMKRMVKGNKVERENADTLKGWFSVHDMLERQLKRA